MWFAVLALAGASAAAAETQCGCTDAQYYNAKTRTCVDNLEDLPTNWTGGNFIFNTFEYIVCPAKPQWTGYSGYVPVYDNDQCSCIASHVINLNTDVDTAVGYTWDYSTGLCNMATLKYEGPGTTPKSNEIDVKECAYKLVNGYPNAFSSCGSLNMCHCIMTHRFTEDAVYLSPDHNATDNAPNINGASYRQCGWDFAMGACVEQSEKFSGNPLILNRDIRTANSICESLGYYADQVRIEDAPVTRYVPPPFVSPTISICNALDISSCTCNEDSRCFMDVNSNCVPHMVDDIEVNRTDANVTAELIMGKCGDTYCNTFLTPCDCYETPHSTGVCGWDGTVCDSTTTTTQAVAYEAHCCDAFKTPCDCKVGRLPWNGIADFNNTCGWDHDKDVCRLSGITTDAEMINNGCASSDPASPDSCVLAEIESDCNVTICSWLTGRHACIRQ